VARPRDPRARREVPCRCKSCDSRSGRRRAGPQGCAEGRAARGAETCREGREARRGAESKEVRPGRESAAGSEVEGRTEGEGPGTEGGCEKAGREEGEEMIRIVTLSELPPDVV